MADLKEIDFLTREWLKQAGEAIKASFEKVLNIETKSDQNDLVTNIDKETEYFFAENIRKQFPSHRIIGEEGFGDELTSLKGVVWIIDPIDGTANFIHQQRNFYISIGIYIDGEGKLGYLYDVVHDELYFGKAGEGAYFNGRKLPKLEIGEVKDALIGINASWLAANKYINQYETLIPLVNDVRGTRSYGSAALELAYVATGRLDCYISMRLAPWDIAGGKVIIEELGGVVTTLNGGQVSLLETTSIIAAKPGLHERILNDYFNK